jgi:uncharacterized protein
MYISKELLKIIVCPVTKQKLIYSEEGQELVSPEAGLSFPIRNGIPILLVDEARTIHPDRLKKILEKEAKESVVSKTA